MTIADQLLDRIFSWVEKRRSCANELNKLADELESYQKAALGGQCVGSTVAVVGAACLIGSVLTGGAAAPFLGLLGAAYTGTGLTISVASKLVESFLSSKTLKKAKDVEEECNNYGEEIQRLFERLKQENMEKEKFSNLDELDDCITIDILNSMARRSGLKKQFHFRNRNDLRSLSLDRQMPLHGGNGMIWVSIAIHLWGVLAFFCLNTGGKKSGSLLSQGLQQLTKTLALSGSKIFFSTAAKLVGGTVGMAFALPEAISNWSQMIKNNHVTEASQSLRDTAKAIRKMANTLKEQLDQIRKSIQQMEEEEKEEEAKLATVKRCIEASNRSVADTIILKNFAFEKCYDEYIRQFLKSPHFEEVYLQLLSLCHLLVKRVEENLSEEEKKKKDDDNFRKVDVIFVAHGSINDPKIPASSLLPMCIDDVLLYSPWNCVIDAKAAYGIATGLLQPSHRSFMCRRSLCTIDHTRVFSPQHKPLSLPNRWNSMKESKTQIPNIMVSTLRYNDKAWKTFVDLTEEYGRPGRSRIVIPFLPFGKQDRLPFYVVTFVLGLVMFVFRMRATVHLAACLGDRSKKKFDRSFLETQYAYTIDNTAMTTLNEMFEHRHPDLYQALQAVFRL